MVRGVVSFIVLIAHFRAFALFLPLIGFSRYGKAMTTDRGDVIF